MLGAWKIKISQSEIERSQRNWRVVILINCFTSVRDHGCVLYSTHIYCPAPVSNHQIVDRRRKIHGDALCSLDTTDFIGYFMCTYFYHIFKCINLYVYACIILMHLLCYSILIIYYPKILIHFVGGFYTDSMQVLALLKKWACTNLMLSWYLLSVFLWSSLSLHIYDLE